MADPKFHEAPLVHLINTDVHKLDPEQLEQHISKLRSIRASPQTTRAETNNKTRKSRASIDAAKEML